MSRRRVPQQAARTETRVSPAARIIVLLMPLLFLAVLEGIFRLAGVGRPDEADPFIGLLKSHRVFQLNPKTGQYYIDRDRARSFNVQAFPALKAKDTFRIFCFGGSAAFGYPFGDPVSFSRWLRDACKTLWPNRRFEVINAAGMSYGSYRERALLDEILDYSPDLVIAYGGHNEFIEKDFYRPESTRLLGLRSFLSRFRIYNLLKEGVLGITQKRKRLAAGVNEFGLHVERRENVTWTPEERETVYRKFNENVTAMAERLRQRKVPMMIIVPGPNLGDWKPEHSSLNPSLQGELLAAWSNSYGAGVSSQTRQAYAEAKSHYQDAIKIDDAFAELHYRLGQCSEATGDYPGAASEFREALDRDDVPIRIGSRQRQILHQVAAREKTLFADAWGLFTEVSPHGIVGSEFLWDYCHPDIVGHQYVAALACSVLVASHILPPPAAAPPDLLTRPVRDVSLAVLGLAPPDSVRLANLPRGADGLWWLGNCAQRQGRADEAQRWFAESLQADPNHPGALIGLAISRSQEGRHEEAISMGQRAVAAYERAGLMPLVARSRFELSVFYSRAGRFQDAVQELRRVLAINPAYPGAHKNLGRALVDLHEYAEAEKTLQDGIKVFANEPGLHKELGRSYRLQNRVEDAIEQYRQEEKIAPGDAGTHFLLGELYRQAGRTDEAIAEWQVVLTLDPGQEEAVIALARLCAAAGKPEVAREAVARFLHDHRGGAELVALRKSLGI